MIDQRARKQILEMIGYITDEVDRHFGDPSVVEPLELTLDRGDESLERSRLVGKGVEIGLREDLAPMRVSAQVDEAGYLFKVERK